MLKSRRCLVATFLLACTVGLSMDVPCLGADWNRFRGPNGSGIAEQGEAPPTQWSENENVKWKVPLPGPGVSSPIVVGDKVFVTAYSGYGAGDQDASLADLKRHLICVNTQNGSVAWEKVVPSEGPEDPYAFGLNAHGYASHTPTSDGTNVYAFFGKSGVIAYSMDGKELWRAKVGTESDPRRWGSSSSPIVHEDVLIVAAGPESRAVIGFDKHTGKELWRAEADGLGNVWGTPAVVESETSTDIVIGAPYEIWALNPENGKLRWYCLSMETDQFQSSVVVDDDKIYAIEGRGGGSIALKAGGRDDITESNVIWTGRDSARFGSPVIFEGRLYYVNNGIATCIDASTGKEIFKGRLRGDSSSADRGDEERGGPPGGFGGDRGGFGGGPPGGFGGGRGRGGGRGGRGGGMSGDYASPIIAGGHVYYLKANGEMFVFKASSEFEQVSANKVTSASESFGGTPAISGSAIF